MDDAAVFRRFHEAWTAGDLQEVLALADPEIVARPVHGWLFSRLEYRGLDGLRQWYEEMTGPWERYEVLVEHKLLTRAQELLAQLPGARPNPFA